MGKTIGRAKQTLAAQPRSLTKENMKRFILTALLIAPVIVHADATALQNELLTMLGNVAKVGVEYGSQVKAMADSIAPTEEQMTRLRTLEANYKVAIAQIQNNKNLSLQQKQSQLQQLNVQTIAAIRATLTPAQLEFIEKLKQTRSITPR